MMNGMNMIGSINGAVRAYRIRQCLRGFAKGLAVGLAVGAAVAAVFGGMMRNDRGFRRRTERMGRDTRELFGNLRDLFQ